MPNKPSLEPSLIFETDPIYFTTYVHSTLEYPLSGVQLSKYLITAIPQKNCDTGGNFFSSKGQFIYDVGNFFRILDTNIPHVSNFDQFLTPPAFHIADVVNEQPLLGYY